MAQAIPASPSSTDLAKGNSWKPYEVDAELATSKLAETIIDRMPAPAIVSKEFVVWLGIYRGLDHSKDNLTYCNTSLFVSIFEGVAHNSVNINGALFEKIFQYLSKPKMVVQGLAGQPLFNEEEEKQSIAQKIMGFFRGGDKKDEPK
jgi:hypothetical protein